MYRITFLNPNLLIIYLLKFSQYLIISMNTISMTKHNIIHSVMYRREIRCHNINDFFELIKYDGVIFIGLHEGDWVTPTIS